MTVDQFARVPFSAHDALKSSEGEDTRGILESGAELTPPVGAAEPKPETKVALEPLDLAGLLSGCPPQVPWLWQGWIARGDLAMIVADPGVGKSLLALALAASVRSGAPFLDAPCAKARVGLFDLENPLDEAHRRLRGVGVTAQEHSGLLYFHAPALDLLRDVGALAEASERYGLDLLIVDSLRRAAPSLEENDSAAVSTVLSPLRVLSAKTGRTILLVHHARKRVGDNPTDPGQMVRGSGDLVASVDSLLYLRSKEAGRFTLEHAKARRGMPHEPIVVRIKGDGEAIRLVNEGAVAKADDRVEAMLVGIVAALREDGVPLGRPTLADRIGTSTNNGTFSRALKLGWRRGLLEKTEPERVGAPALYALTPGIAA